MRVTISSKGQLTIPKEIREKLSLQAGDQIELIENEAGQYVMMPITTSIFSLYGFMPKPERSFSIEEISDAINSGFGHEGEI